MNALKANNDNIQIYSYVRHGLKSDVTDGPRKTNNAEGYQSKHNRLCKSAHQNIYSYWSFYMYLWMYLL